MPAPFRLSGQPAPVYRGWLQSPPPSPFGNDFVYGPGQGPDQFKPQQLGAQGPIAMTAAGPAPQPSAGIGATHPAMGVPTSGHQWLGTFDQRAPGGMAVPDVQRNYLAPPSAGRADSQHEFLGSRPGGFAERQPAEQSTGLDWQPATITAPVMGGPPAAPRARGPMLPNNSAPAYRSGNGMSLEPGQWNQAPGYVGSNGTVYTRNEPGSQHQAPGYVQGGMGQPSGGGGGVPVGYGGGGGYNPLQAFIDAQNAANAANASRANDLNQGYSAQRKYANDLLSGLGQQDIRDTNTAFDNSMSRAQQGMIDSGLANSSVMADQYRGNARDRSSALARVQDQITQRRLGTELPLMQQQLAFNERINQNAPDPNLLAQLAMGMGQYGGGGPRYGAPMMIGSGDIGYQMPGISGYMPMPGYRGGSQLVKNGGRPTYGSGVGSGASGSMGGISELGPIANFPVLDLNLGGAGMKYEPPVRSSAKPSDALPAFPPGTDFGGDWNLGGARQNKPMFPWMYSA